MEIEDTKKIEDLLKKIKAHLLRVDRGIDDDIKIASEERKGDEVDIADSDSKRDLAFQLKNRGALELKMIDEAIKRIEDGEYGICAECGDDIPYKRLKVLPYSIYCVKCQEKKELSK